MPDAIHHLAGVINSAIIRAQLNYRQAKWAGIIGFVGRNLTNTLTYFGFIKTMGGNAANQTISIAVGL